MASTRTRMFTAIRILLLSVSVLVGVAGTVQASTLTLNFSGSVDMSGSGGSAVNPFSGFITWDPAKVPFDTDPNAAFYALEAYQLIFNGVPVDPSLGAGLVLVDDGNAFGTGNVDALVFLATIEENAVVNGVTGDKLFVAALSGNTNTWNSLSLPADYSFLSSMTTRFSGVSLEVPFNGDENDVLLGGGNLAVTVPEPSTVSLIAVGVAGLAARARRVRRRHAQ